MGDGPRNRPTGEFLKLAGEATDPPKEYEQRPPTPGNMTDYDLLPRHVRLVAAELRDLSEAVHGHILPTLRRIEARQIEQETFSARVAADIHSRLDQILLALAR